MKEKYRQKLLDPTKPKSQKAHSYVRAIEILSELLNLNLFEMSNIDYLQNLYEDLKLHQTDVNGKYYYSKAPSYGINRYYSSAVRELIKFLQEDNIVIEEDYSDYITPIKEEVKSRKRELKIAYNGDDLYEGSKKIVSVATYNRNIQARRVCIANHGYTCCICGFNFAQVYGKIGEDFIHVHHLTMLSEIGEEQKIDPVEDLRPVCPNCHAMLHRQVPPLTIEELKEIVKCNS